eukprot:CAMPEP_0116845422 /NCGR_PEP_ID=MMETSP0418-20121206/13258_1 /TAXON_ID=1158023 /ORGANISM="Astrosyne radiata, Strain 13vi08-1A" /LENGTH=115 /DNA_ID=CAMNT_0004476531 /DNA_START=78 /DNA_END=425 /DNA_ORIENTATION=+
MVCNGSIWRNVVLVLLLIAMASADPCIGYSKGSFSGNVTTEDICKDACQQAEGLCCGDFKSSASGNETAYQCQCFAQGSSSRRDLCKDDDFSGAAVMAFAMFGMAMTTLFAWIMV